jgi:hypothetical protein
MGKKMYSVRADGGFYSVEMDGACKANLQMASEFEMIGKRHMRGSSEKGLYKVATMQMTHAGASIPGPTFLGGIKCSSKELGSIVNSLSASGWEEKREP